MVSAKKPRAHQAPVTLNYHNHILKHVKRYREIPPHWRPRVRGDCADAPRPCPFVGCRYNLFLDAKKNGSILLNFGEDVGALEKMSETCALDVADRGQHDDAVVGEFFNFTKLAARAAVNAAIAEIERQQS